MKKLALFWLLFLLTGILIWIFFQPPYSLKEAETFLQVSYVARVPGYIKELPQTSLLYKAYILGLGFLYKLIALFKLNFLSLPVLRLVSLVLFLTGISVLVSLFSIPLSETSLALVLGVVSCYSVLFSICTLSPLPGIWALCFLIAWSLFCSDEARALKYLSFLFLAIGIFLFPFLFLTLWVSLFITSLIFRKTSVLKTMFSPQGLALFVGCEVFLFACWRYFFGSFPKITPLHLTPKEVFSLIPILLKKRTLLELAPFVVLFVMAPLGLILNTLKKKEPGEATIPGYLLIALGLFVILSLFSGLKNLHHGFVFLLPFLVLLMVGIVERALSSRVILFVILVWSILSCGFYFGKTFYYGEKLRYRIGIMETALSKVDKTFACFWKSYNPLIAHYFTKRVKLIKFPQMLKGCRVVISPERIEGYSVKGVFLDPYSKKLWYVLETKP